MVRTATTALSLSLLILFTSCAGGNSALITAVEKGDAATVQSLLANGADQNAKDKDGTPILVIAAAAKDDNIALYTGQNLDWRAILQALLDKGADVNAKDKDGETALLKASFVGRITAVEALLAKGADVNATNKVGETALMLVPCQVEFDVCIAIG